MIRGVSGFVSYCLVRTADGGFSVSVFVDRAGTEESNRRAADWIRQNAPQVAGSPPEVIEGEAILQLSSEAQNSSMTACSTFPVLSWSSSSSQSHARGSGVEHQCPHQSRAG